VRELFDAHGVSTILVMGGCGDYFDVADHVIAMRDYLPRDATAEARRVARERVTGRRSEATEPMRASRARVPHPASLDPSRGRREVKVDAVGTDAIRFGRSTIDLGGVDQLVDTSQTAAVARLLVLARERWMGHGVTVPDLLDAADAFIDHDGLDALAPRQARARHPGDYARPRRHEIAAALNRLRTLRVGCDG
jgi:predicted ABC-class ATPase